MRAWPIIFTRTRIMANTCRRRCSREMGAIPQQQRRERYYLRGFAVCYGCTTLAVVMIICRPRYDLLMNISRVGRCACECIVQLYTQLQVTIILSI